MARAKTYTYTWAPRFVGMFSTGNYSDPCLFDKSLFDDGQYRMLVHCTDGGAHHELWKTADFSSWTQISDDWSDEPGAGANTFQDSCVLGDGETILLMQNDGTEGTTALWTGSAADLDAATMTKVGRVLSTGGDGGCFYEAGADLVHLFTEDPDHPYGSVSSSQLTHYTVPANDLLNPTRHANVFDTGGGWGTGDPDVFEFRGRYWMICDYTETHPAYWASLLVSDDLYTWTLVNLKINEPTGVRGGDFDCLVLDDGSIVCFTEYTNNQFRVGRWNFNAALIPAVLRLGTDRANVVIANPPG